MTFDEAIRDKDFQALPFGERQYVLTQIDSDYAALPKSEQSRVLVELKNQPFWGGKKQPVMMAAHTPGQAVTTREKVRQAARSTVAKTAPATSVSDWATRVLPESAAKIIPRVVAGTYEMAKGQVEPIVKGFSSEFDNPQYSIGDEMKKNALSALKGVAAGTLQGVGVGQDEEGDLTWSPENAKEAWLSDPVGAGLGLAGVKAGAKWLKKPGSTGPQIPKELRNVEANISQTVQSGIDKGVRPTVAGKSTHKQTQQYYGKAQNAVENIISNKGSLSLTDDFGEVVPDSTPQNLRQFSQAISQTKDKIYQQYNDMAMNSTGKGIDIDLSPISNELNPIINNRVLNNFAPDVVQYAAEKANALNTAGAFTAKEVQGAIGIMNNSLEAFYRNPSYQTASKAYVDSIIANNMRKALDKTIESTEGPGYQTLKNNYGSLKAIEKEVNQRAVVDARKNSKGLIDFTDVFTGAEAVKGLISMNPATVGAGVSAGLISRLIKAANNPNRKIKNMFYRTEKLMNVRKKYRP